MAIMRKADGVTQSWEEILALPQEEAEALVVQVGGAFAPNKDAKGLAVVDLVPGDYVATCFVPAGHHSGERRHDHGGHRNAALHARHDLGVHGRGLTVGGRRLRLAGGGTGGRRGGERAAGPAPPLPASGVAVADAVRVATAERVPQRRTRHHDRAVRRPRAAAPAEHDVRRHDEVDRHRRGPSAIAVACPVRPAVPPATIVPGPPPAPTDASRSA